MIITLFSHFNNCVLIEVSIVNWNQELHFLFHVKVMLSPYLVYAVIHLYCKVWDELFI